MRIISLLPSATEMVYALGLGDQLVGVSHTCDYPDDANSKPVVSRSIRQIRHMSSLSKSTPSSSKPGPAITLSTGSTMNCSGNCART